MGFSQNVTLRNIEYQTGNIGYRSVFTSYFGVLYSIFYIPKGAKGKEFAGSPYRQFGHVWVYQILN